ncbi:MAG: hypothetical protein V4668_00310 [Patescibacteria group bacterium]
MTPLPWHEVEQKILTEERWLNEVFDFGPFSGEDSTPVPPGLSNDKMLRQIAIAIVNGQIEACEIQSALEFRLWTNININIDEIDEGNERHGSQWHRSMMSIVKQHFINEGFEVVNEPYLSIGRADLGVYKSGYPDMFVEIGTTSLFKTWFNMKTMPNKILLFVPTTAYAIEFKIKESSTSQIF